MEYYAVNTSDALAHHGVLGQKWGVRRYQNADGSLTTLGKRREHKIESYDKKNERLAYKVERKERRAARLERRAERVHAIKDLGRSNRAARKSANYELKAAKIRKKAIGEEDEIKRLKLEAKAAKKQYKSDKYHTKADTLSKLTGYSARAMHLAIKSDRVKAQASKARMKIANNKRVQALMKKSISEIPTYENFLNNHPEHKLSSKEVSNRKRINDIETKVNSTDMSKSEKSKLLNEAKSLVKQNDSLYQARVKKT